MTCHCSLMVQGITTPLTVSCVGVKSWVHRWLGVVIVIEPGRAAYNNSNNKGAANIPVAIVQHQTGSLPVL